MYSALGFCWRAPRKQDQPLGNFPVGNENTTSVSREEKKSRLIRSNIRPLDICTYHALVKTVEMISVFFRNKIVITKPINLQNIVVVQQNRNIKSLYDFLLTLIYS